MTIIAGILYVLYFLVLGYGLCVIFNTVYKENIMGSINLNTLGSSFLLGIVIHVIIFNAFQYIELSQFSLKVSVLLIWLVFLFFVIKNFFSSAFKHVSFVPNLSQVLILSTILLCTLFIFWNGSITPNIAWDSWSVWEGKSKQWVYHGLYVDIEQWDAWLQNQSSIYNHSSQYPDGLSLIMYLPELIFSDGYRISYFAYLFAFGMVTIMMTNRLEKMGSPLYLRVFMVLVLYTTPFISNHLMIFGYADMWLGIFVLVFLLSLFEYLEKKNASSRLSAVCFLVMLPMLKLEGMVWFTLLIFAAIIVHIFNSKNGKWILLTSAISLGLIVLLVGINISLPFGDFILNHERLKIFNIIDTTFNLINISDQLWISFFWQNNWSIIWLGLPFLLVAFVIHSHNQANQIANLFLTLALSSLLFLFYFTEASKWAEDFTAINRVVLQLTPCYLFLLAQLMIKVCNFRYKPRSQPASF